MVAFLGLIIILMFFSLVLRVIAYISGPPGSD